MVNKLENTLSMSQAAPVESRGYGISSSLKKVGYTLALSGALLSSGCAGYRVNGVNMDKPTEAKTGWCAENPKSCTALKIGAGAVVVGGIVYLIHEANDNGSSHSSSSTTTTAPVAEDIVDAG